MCLTRQRDYDATPNAIGAARDFVSAFTLAMLDPSGWSVSDDAALLVSELMSSAVEAGCRNVGVVVDLHFDRLELVVTGHGAADAPEGLAGLRGTVVKRLASRAELVHAPEGTLVGAAQLPCREIWTSSVPCDDRR